MCDLMRIHQEVNVMKVKTLFVSIIFAMAAPTLMHAVETCDDEDVIADDYTECDIMFDQMFNELAYYQHEFETPIQYDTSEGQYEIHAFDIIVDIEKDIELHVFYDLTFNEDADRRQYANLLAHQDNQNAMIYEISPKPRLDQYNEYRSSTETSDTIHAARVMKLHDYHEPITLFYTDEDKITPNKRVEIETIDFSDSLNFNDIPDETVSISDAEDFIETRNVFINIKDVERKDDTIIMTYEATVKTRYNTERIINTRYVQLVQETDPNAFTVLENEIDVSRDNQNQGVSSFGIPIGDTVEIVKIAQLHDTVSPIILRIIDEPSHEIVYSEDISEYLKADE